MKEQPLYGGRSTSSAHDLWARTYDGGHNPMLAATLAIIEQTVDPRGLHVLELGCGTGRIGRHLLDRGAASYTGIDNSQGMLNVAARHGPSQSRWLRGNIIEALNVTPETYDLALVVLVLEHIDDVTSVFHNAFAALKPGGQLRVLEVHPDILQQGARAHFVHESGDVFFALHPHDANELAWACSRAGLTPAPASEHSPAAHLFKPFPRLRKYERLPLILDFSAAKPKLTT